MTERTPATPDGIAAAIRDAASKLTAAPTPYTPLRSGLYTVDELTHELDGATLDDRIYQYYMAKGGHSPDATEAFFQHVHDYSMDVAFRRAVGDSPADRENVIAFMGGHGTSRLDSYFKGTAETAFHVIRKGLRVVSGGGPGIMEAANVGAYFACNDYSLDNMIQGFALLSAAPTCPPDPLKEPETYRRYLDAAKSVVKRYPPKVRQPSNHNLAVPTWFYGWEPTNYFAQGIAKYFSNGLREDGLVAVGVGGIVFAPGGPGTTQEMFMDTAQNVYQTHGYSSAMVMMGVQRYSVFTAHCQLLFDLLPTPPQANMLFATDSPIEAVEFLIAHRPVAKQ